MHVISARNVNDALGAGLRHLRTRGNIRPSRNGPVLSAPTPVATVYSHPRERVLFSPMRNANPFFHLMEALWMISGRNDITFPAMFNANFRSYASKADPTISRDAYGHRWRNWYGYDQLAYVLRELRRDLKSRQVVLSMWDPILDPEAVADQLGEMVPCNTHVYFRADNGALDMTVCNRSNDIIWGCYGANAVHMSVLQEYIAMHLGMAVGTYTQVSNNFHMYTDLYPTIVTPSIMPAMADDTEAHNLYLRHPPVYPTQLLREDELPEEWDNDLEQFMEGGGPTFKTRFFRCIAHPMREMWLAYKTGVVEATYLKVAPSDWSVACRAWVDRQLAKRTEKGVV